MRSMPVLLDIYLYVATLPPSKTVCIFPPLSFLLLSHLRFFQYIPVPFLSPINRRKALSQHSIRNDFPMIRPDKSFICSLLSGNDYYEAAMRGERERERGRDRLKGGSIRFHLFSRIRASLRILL